jgi:hypothetical protein
VSTGNFFWVLFLDFSSFSHRLPSRVFHRQMVHFWTFCPSSENQVFGVFQRQRCAAVQCQKTDFVNRRLYIVLHKYVPSKRVTTHSSLSRSPGGLSQSSKCRPVCSCTSCVSNSPNQYTYIMWNDETDDDRIIQHSCALIAKAAAIAGKRCVSRHHTI